MGLINTIRYRGSNSIFIFSKIMPAALNMKYMTQYQADRNNIIVWTWCFGLLIVAYMKHYSELM
jgi:hypothetical protein